MPVRASAPCPFPGHVTCSKHSPRKSRQARMIGPAPGSEPTRQRGHGRQVRSRRTPRNAQTAPSAASRPGTAARTPAPAGIAFLAKMNVVRPMVAADGQACSPIRQKVQSMKRPSGSLRLASPASLRFRPGPVIAADMVSRGFEQCHLVLHETREGKEGRGRLDGFAIGQAGAHVPVVAGNRQGPEPVAETA